MMESNAKNVVTRELNTIEPTAAATHQTQVAAVSAPQAVRKANRPRLTAFSISHPIADVLEAHRASVMMARLMGGQSGWPR